ncbi:hypothetical protein IFR05_008040 [Cadophora sp. M221]|nr:hypothetical protein IFR05_008040 [Cadophora sp. M221]
MSSCNHEEFLCMVEDMLDQFTPGEELEVISHGFAELGSITWEHADGSFVSLSLMARWLKGKGRYTKLISQNLKKMLRKHADEGVNVDGEFVGTSWQGIKFVFKLFEASTPPAYQTDSEKSTSPSPEASPRRGSVISVTSPRYLGSRTPPRVTVFPPQRVYAAPSPPGPQSPPSYPWCINSPRRGSVCSFNGPDSPSNDSGSSPKESDSPASPKSSEPSKSLKRKADDR